MQTSPCCMFRIPIPCFLRWHNPDRVHGGWLRYVNKANSVCRQKIIVPSDFVCYSWCDWSAPDWCLKKGNQWQKNWTSSRGGATMQTSPCRAFRIPIPRFLRYGNPNRVHGGRTRAVNTSNSYCKQSIIVPLGCSSYIVCDCLSPG